MSGHESLPKPGAILLAAGGSSRLGQPKQLVTIKGQTLVSRQAQLLLASAPASVVVVTGANQASVRSELHGLPVTFRHNPAWHEGMGGSIAAGVKALPAFLDGVLILLCDQWRIELADLLRLVGAWQRSPHHAIVSDWPGASGPPVILPAAMFPALERLHGQQGARLVWQSVTNGFEKVPVPNAAFDLDTITDLDGLG